MKNTCSGLTGARVERAEKILRAAIHSWNHQNNGKTADQGAPVFITVSRQPGAGAITFSHRLAERLSRESRHHWSAWDRELVEKVSAEHGIAKEIIEAIPNRHHSWLDDLLQSLTVSESPSDLMEIRAYQRVAMSIRALAAAGHAVIVGRGGNFITRQMPGAIHLRLVAPPEYRIKYTAERDNIPIHEAAERIVEIDRNRAEFYHRYWRGKVLAPETFTMTLNSGELSMDELIECVIPLIRMREAAGKGADTAGTPEVGCVGCAAPSSLPARK